MENQVKEFKYMKKTEGVAEGYIYVPWIPITTKTFINNIQVWDCRWWKNMLCKINWFLHFRLRKRYNHWKNQEVKLGKAVNFARFTTELTHDNDK